MARQRLLDYSQHTKALENLNIAGDRAAVALQRPRQVADRTRRRFYLSEQKHAFLSQHPKKIRDVIEGDHAAGRNRIAAIRQAGKFAPALKECVHSFHADFSASHVLPLSPLLPARSIPSESAPQSVQSHPNSPQSLHRDSDDGAAHEPSHTPARDRYPPHGSRD